MVIRSFKSKDTESLFNGVRVRRFAAIENIARRKLLQLHASVQLYDLAVPPGNRLEALRGERQGQYSIRINDQYRVCFVWINNGVEDVEIVDYH
jgi:proteic killer suppression protein